MSDELITYVIGQLRGACWEEEAAAVEALVQERDEALAKLAKAVEALREIVSNQGYMDDPWGHAAATLAELEGK